VDVADYLDASLLHPFCADSVRIEKTGSFINWDLSKWTLTELALEEEATFDLGARSWPQMSGRILS
jgi:hypothetical protein